MPRPRKNATGLAPKNGVRSHKFSIVVHDIIPQTDAKKRLEDLAKSYDATWYLVGEEEYNHQDGHHIHLFLRYEKAKAKSIVEKFSLLDIVQKMKIGGRVDIKYGKGSFESCKKYLTDPGKKNKNIDSNLVEYVDRRRLPLAERYPDETSVCIQCSQRYYDCTLKPGEDFLLKMGSYDPKICRKCDAKANRKNLLARLPEKKDT